MTKVRLWCGQPLDGGRLKNRTHSSTKQHDQYVLLKYQYAEIIACLFVFFLIMYREQLLRVKLRVKSFKVFCYQLITVQKKSSCYRQYMPIGYIFQWRRSPPGTKNHPSLTTLRGLPQSSSGMKQQSPRWASGGKKLKTRHLYTTLSCEFASNALRIARVNDGFHSFTGHPRVYPRMK